ncbi:conserved hypothetical protein [Streptomyces viridosporus ATCC 14672]|uniref:Secreted protein n=1 Tax=Streptomyces viridosporus (strain ATCC 14672 / DSM 40746 / JCM 4963 / KCTC 9882 / NRRL B-12104 / FH 1290) TaxID=566461 RepID=D5ZUP4_STRV1|nr:conserved hypothetical protein [Streptomyces viridosporus ATCC 14672]
MGAMRIRMRGSVGAAALVGAFALTLAGCGDADGGTEADGRPAAVTATPGSAGSAPEASPEASDGTGSPTATPTPAPTPVTLPDFTGRSIGTAVRAAEKADVDHTVRLQGTGRAASTWAATEKVCEQTDGFDGVTFTVPRDGRDCAGRLLHTPKPTPTPKPARTEGPGGTGTGTGTGVCELTSPAGNCYADGQFCAAAHRGLSTHGRGGEYLTCAQDSAGRWRWSDGVPG